MDTEVPVFGVQCPYEDCEHKFKMRPAGWVLALQLRPKNVIDPSCPECRREVSPVVMLQQPLGSPFPIATDMYLEKLERPEKPPKLTESQIEMIKYFHDTKGDIEMWAEWEDALPSVREHHPGLLRAMMHAKTYNDMLDREVAKLEAEE